MDRIDRPQILTGPFEPTLDSLKTYAAPDWFRDAKFGIWSHWGPQSVPMYGDWYARNMYIEGSPQYLYHWRRYGHPSRFGFKDVAALWQAERFDPAGLMDLYVESGARYFVGQAVHHDNFDNYDSPHHPWNSVRVGPHKDICALWQAEAKRHGLPFGLSEHLGASYTWFSASHGADKSGPYAGVPYDGADPANRSLYRDNDSEWVSTPDGWNWYTRNPRYQADWFSRIRDVVDRFQPDLLYSDGEVPFGETGYALVAHLYNTSALANGGVNRAVYTFKQHDARNKAEGVTRIGVLDIERGLSPDPLPEPWQDDTSLGDWFYNVRDVYKTAEEVADTLVDIVSKNGNLLMNVTQRPDGTIDDEARYTLKRLGKWLRENGDGIYGSRPNAFHREGKTELAGGPFQEGKATWLPTDFRFTRKPGAVHAYMMRPGSGEKAVIHHLGRLDGEIAGSVSVSGRPTDFEQRDGALVVRLPDGIDRSMPVCIRIGIDG
ncbi:MAG: alpha-L-fucosidase [Clostridia bacterium]|nr:alpha-L-fucosidase [Clostridia bacterium]